MKELINPHMAVMLIIVAMSFTYGYCTRDAHARTYTQAVGCSAKGGAVVAGVCIDRRVIIR